MALCTAFMTAGPVDAVQSPRIQPKKVNLEAPVRGRMVTGAWLLQNDRQMLVNAFSASDRSSRRAVMSLLPKHLRGPMSNAGLQLQKFRAPLGRSQAERAARSMDPVSLIHAPMGFKPFELRDLYLMEQITTSLDLGSGIAGVPANPVRFVGIAAKTGSLKVITSEAGGSKWTEIRTFTGVIKNSIRVIDRTVPITQQQTVIPIKAGQEYQVAGVLDTSTAGKKSGILHISDGTSLTVNLKGDVVPKNGSINYGASVGSIYLRPSDSAEFTVPFEVSGNAASKISLRVEDAPRGINVDVSPSAIEMPAKGKGVFTVKVTCERGTENTYDEMLKLTIKGFDGSAEGPLDIPVTIETRWAIFGDWSLNAGDVHHSGNLKFSDVGDFSAYLYFSTSAWFSADPAKTAFAFTTPINAAGRCLGYAISPSLSGNIYGKDDSTDSLIGSGVVQAIMDNFDKLAEGGGYVKLSNDPGAIDGWVQSKTMISLNLDWKRI